MSEPVQQVGRVNGFDVWAYNGPSDKGYRVKLPDSPYEITVEQSWDDRAWNGPVLFMSDWPGDEHSPFPPDGATTAIFLLGVVATVFTKMLLEPNEPCTLDRFDPMYDGDLGHPR